MKWVGTFKNEIGEDAIVDHFSQLNDGIILFKIIKCITKPYISKKDDVENTNIKKRHLSMNSNLNKFL